MTAMPVQLRPLEPLACWPWHLWRLAMDDGRHPSGGRCAQCSQDVAVPRGYEKRRTVCLYCALDLGLVAAEPQPFADDGRTAFFAEARR